jgi:hypothetical protein
MNVLTIFLKIFCVYDFNSIILVFINGIYYFKSIMLISFSGVPLWFQPLIAVGRFFISDVQDTKTIPLGLRTITYSIG